MNEIESLADERDCMPVAEEPDFEVIDGYVISEDGEIIDVVPPLPVSQLKTVFRIDSPDAAAWVMEKMMDVDAAICGIDAKIRAIIDNLDAERRRQFARRDWLLKRFAAELEQYAKANLRGKSRTWSCAYGKVSFRKTQPGYEVCDEDKAIRLIRELVPTAVKTTEHLLISECKEILPDIVTCPYHGVRRKSFAQAVNVEGVYVCTTCNTACHESLDGIEIKAAGESCKISTGVV